MKYHKETNVQLTVNIKNDTLYLAANNWAKREEYEKGTRNNQNVSLTLPGDLPVTLQYGALFLSGSADSAHAPSYNIELARHAHLGIKQREPREIPACFNRVQVVSNASNIELDAQTVINEMTMKATNSYLDYNSAVIKQHNLEMDDKTTIKATQKSLYNINLTPKQ